MDSSKPLNSLEAGLRRDDAGSIKQAFSDGHQVIEKNKRRLRDTIDCGNSSFMVSCAWQRSHYRDVHGAFQVHAE